MRGWGLGLGTGGINAFFGAEKLNRLPSTVRVRVVPLKDKRNT
jgi:hypothetical protein